MRKTTEQFIEESKNKFGDKFDYSNVNYINNDTKVILTCKIHNNTFEIIPRLHLFKKGGCKLCASESRRNAKQPAKKTTEQFIEESKNKFGDKFDYSKCVYTGANKEITLVCKKCNTEFIITPHNHLRRNGGCPKCAIEKVSNLKRLTQEEVLEKCKERKEYDCSKIKYIDAYTKIEIVCKKHGSFWLLPYNFYGNKQGCPHCKQSRMEREIENYLIDNNINFVHEKVFDDLLDKKLLSYDFYIPERKLLIECQGIQHYEPVEFFGGKEAFLLQKHHDWLKRKYAKKNGYKLITIPYWEENIIKLII